LIGAGLAGSTALITDGRFSGASHGFIIGTVARHKFYLRRAEADTTEDAGHVVPEARLGGPIALVQNGDKIILDAEKRTIDWDVSEEEQARRRVEWEGSGRGLLTVKRGILLRYARDVAVRGVQFYQPDFSG
jgi:dihydroxy-acid dehydratase